MSAVAALETAETRLLGQRIRCHQPTRGYRTAIDPVFLAAAVPARPGDRVLDVGTGCGAAAFCLAARVPGCRVTGLEVQAGLAELARAGVRDNDFGQRVEIVTGDLLDPPAACGAAAFDHVMANPPYMRAGSGRRPADPVAAVATIEGPAKLADWLRFCFLRAADGGTVTVVHRADRLDEIVGLFEAQAGTIHVLPLAPKAGAAANRVLVQGRKGGDAAAVRLDSFIVHRADGTYTAAAEAILRDAEDLLLSAS